MIKGSLEYIEFRKKANERNRKYYSKPEVKVRKKIYKTEYDKNNKEKIKEYGLALRARPEYKERIKKWREDNKDYLRQKNKEWRELHKEKIKIRDKAYRKLYYHQHKGEIKAYRDKYNKEFAEVNRLSKKKYNSSPKGKICSTKYVHKRLTLIHKAEFDLTSQQIVSLFEQHKTCVYCSSPNNLELDHIQPLSNGGMTTYNNMTIACRTCNSSKGNKDVAEWCKTKGYLIPTAIL